MRRFVADCAVVAALVAGMASVGAAQDPRLRSRMDPRTAAAVTRLVDSARARSLPAEPLVQKALQGAAKRAPSERVIAAVRGLMHELGLARASLGSRSTEAELVAGAGAVHAGVPGGTLARIRALRGSESTTVPVATLADLISRGVPVDTASKAVLTLIGRGARDADFMAFGRQVARDVDAGAPPAVAARVRSAAPPGRGRAATPRPVPQGVPTPPAGQRGSPRDPSRRP